MAALAGITKLSIYLFLFLSLIYALLYLIDCVVYALLLLLLLRTTLPRHNHDA